MCQFQRDTNLYKPGKGYHEDVLKHAKPVYESFNSLIWKHSPKSKYCGLKKLKFSVYDAIGYFNYGGQSIIDTLKLLNISNAAMYTTKIIFMTNAERKYNAAYKARASSKTKRKVIWWLKKKKSDNIKIK